MIVPSVLFATSQPILTTEDFLGLCRSLPFVLSMTGEFYFYVFASQSSCANALLHTWFLSVDFQFYLAYSLLAIWKRKWVRMSLQVGVFLATLMLFVLLPKHGLNFFQPHARFCQFLIGTWIRDVWKPSSKIIDTKDEPLLDKLCSAVGFDPSTLAELLCFVGHLGLLSPKFISDPTPHYLAFLLAVSAIFVAGNRKPDTWTARNILGAR